MDDMPNSNKRNGVMDFALILLMMGLIILPGIGLMIASFISHPDSKPSDETKKLAEKIIIGSLMIFGLTIVIVVISAVIDGGVNWWFLLGILLILAIIGTIKKWIEGG